MHKKSLESGDSVIQASSVYHLYSVPTIFQVITPISFLKKVILVSFLGRRIAKHTPSPHLFFQHRNDLPHLSLRAQYSIGADFALSSSPDTHIVHLPYCYSRNMDYRR